MKNKYQCARLIAAASLLLMSASVVVSAQRAGASDGEAQLASFEDLVYPAIARVARIQGVVVVRVELDNKGNVVAASAITGPKALVADCVTNAKKWKFKLGPQKVAVIAYDFRLDEGACHDASHSLFLLVHPNFATITACAPVIPG
jgi:TonB family protein